MISKSDIKLIRSLQNKESRQEHGLFVAEGDKIVREMLREGLSPEILVVTDEWISLNRNLAEEHENIIKKASPAEIERCSSLKSTQGVLAVCKIPESNSISDITEGQIIALDDVQDPGNVGTIVRIAAWFGIHYIICSQGCSDLYNAKVIQASMGGFNQVKVIYGNLDEMLGLLKNRNFKIAGAFMEGKSVSNFNPPENIVTVFGNESRGISPQVRKKIDIEITIPSFSPVGKGIESLNVSTAAAIICYEFSKKCSYGNCK